MSNSAHALVFGRLFHTQFSLSAWVKHFSLFSISMLVGFHQHPPSKIFTLNHYFDMTFHVLDIVIHGFRYLTSIKLICFVS